MGAGQRAGSDVHRIPSFVRDDEHCVRESSVMDVNGVLTPTFIARFESVEKVSD